MTAGTSLKRKRRLTAQEEWQPSSQEFVGIIDDVTTAPRRRSARLSRRALFKGPTPVVDLTHLSDGEEDEHAAVAERGAQSSTGALDEYAQTCREIHSRQLRDRPRHAYLTLLTDEEEAVVKELKSGKSDTERVATVLGPNGSKIGLARGDLKLLRGRRWLNDELINAFVFMVNARNELVHGQLAAEERQGIPRTYMFSTFFHTCVTRGGYDFGSVARWTKRAKVGILDYDLLLFPVNLGNMHWVLCVIDLAKKCFVYLDSLHSSDWHGVRNVLRRWMRDEVSDKYGEAAAKGLQLEKWAEELNRYQVKRVGALPKTLEPSCGGVGRWAVIPAQGDSGSCGVFVAWAADCLALGIKMYFLSRDMPRLRNRMILDLFKGYLAY